MAEERTLAIIKPDATARGVADEIIERYQARGFTIVAMKRTNLSPAQAEEFYTVHRGKEFYPNLTAFMSSGPCVAMVLEGEDVIAKNREFMGATDPAKALPGTLRREFGSDVQHNVIHGSDGPETARFEISFFFNPLELSS